MQDTLFEAPEKSAVIDTLEKAERNIQKELKQPQKLLKQDIVDIEKEVRLIYENLPKNRPTAIIAELNKETVSNQNLSRVLDNAIRKLDRKFASSAEKEAVKRLKKIREGLVVTKGVAPKDLQIGVNTIINTIQDINDMVKWSNFGGVNKMLLGLKKDLNKALDPIRNTEYGKALERANLEFAELASIYQSDKKIASLMNTSEGRKLYELARDADGLDRLLGILPPLNGRTITESGRDLSREARAVKKDLFRTLADKAIFKPITDVKGDITLAKTANMFKDPESKRLLKYVLGREQFNRLAKVVSVAKQTGEALERFRSLSKTTPTSIDFSEMSKIVAGIFSSFAVGNPIPAMIGFAPMVRLNLFGRVLESPEMVRVLSGGR